MSDVEIKVDAEQALARFSPSGIPEQVRSNLRAEIPSLLRELSSRIDANLAQLKSRKNLQLKGGPQGQMVENANEIVGIAQMTWTGDPKASMVPQVLETGARPHKIRAVNAKALSFFWPKVGSQVFFKEVNHPGFPGINYMERAFQSMQEKIVDRLTQAVRDGVQK